jgi:hypothetical protein
MRGIFFQKPLEFRLEVQGDTFSQGDQISAVLTVKSHASEVAVLNSLSMLLALGNTKKVKAKKDEGAFEVVQSAELERGIELAPGQEIAIPGRFSLERNAVVTDKSQSLYFLYGDSPELSALGNLPLTCTPHPQVLAIFDTFTSVYGFIDKGQFSKDGWTCAKYKAPDTRRLSLVEELVVCCRFEEGAELHVRYDFKVKRFDTESEVKVNVKRGKANVLQQWKETEYLFGSGFLQQQFVEQQIDEALQSVAVNL